MPKTKPVHWDDIMICNCHLCGLELLGTSAEATRRAWLYFGEDCPIPSVCHRVGGRPVCAGCCEERTSC